MTGIPTFIKSVSAPYIYDEEEDEFLDTGFNLHVVTFDGVEIEKLPQHPLVGDESEEINLIGIFSGTAFFLYEYRLDGERQSAVLSFDNENSEWAVVVEDIRAYLESMTGNSGDPNDFKFRRILGFSALNGSPVMYVNHNSSGYAKLYRINLNSLIIDSLGSYVWYTSIVNDSWIAAGPFIYITNDNSQQVAIYSESHEASSFSSNNEEALLGMRMQS